MQRPIAARMGGGNLVTHLAGTASEGMYAALRGVGARLGRMNSYGWRDLSHRPTPQDFDAAMRQAFERGVRPVVLLEYEGSYQFLKPPQPIGSYAEWYEAGRAYARRFRPGGEWARENGAGDFGAEIFTAINEPDVQATIPRRAYHDALAGLADGVHSIDPALAVVPGGFATCNSHGDPTLRGYGPAIADLLQQGKLAGIDLHTYYNERWFPLEKGRFFSAQGCFDRVKAALGITREIGFYATEFNVARDGGWAKAEVAGRLFLTAVWDHLGVVGKDGASATVIAFPWNLVDHGNLEGPAYAMASGDNPWRPEVRAQVLKRVLDLAGAMRFVALDPREAGRFELEGGGRRLYVWQDLPGWTDTPGAAWRLDLPEGSASAELWGWDGRRRRMAVKPGPLVLEDLPGHETYMLLVETARP